MLFPKILKEVVAVGLEIVKEGIRLVADQLSPESKPPGEDIRPPDSSAHQGVAMETPGSAEPPVAETPVDATEAAGTPAAEEAVPEPAEKKTKAATRTRTGKKGAKKGGRKARRKGKKSAADVIYDLIAASEEGVDTATLIRTTGFNPKKVHNNVYKLRQAGKIKNVRKGHYVVA